MKTMIEKSLIKKLLTEDIDGEANWQELETTSESLAESYVEDLRGLFFNVIADYSWNDGDTRDISPEEIRQAMDWAVDKWVEGSYDEADEFEESLTEDTNKSKNSFRVEIKRNGKHYDGETFDTQKEMNEWIRGWKKYQYSVKYGWTFQIYTYKNGEQLRSYEWRT